MDRREFLSGSACAMAMSGIGIALGDSYVNRPLSWGVLVHLGMNEWHEVPQRQTWPNLTDPALVKAVADEYNAADHVRFDETVWRRVTDAFVKAGVNQIVIDLGEGVRYPSHPELAVKGSWSPDRLRVELRRLRMLGLEPVPKLNFSTTHDLWLGVYQRMVSTRKYYQVVTDLIADVCEMFECPRYFHLGMDEETVSLQGEGQSLVVVRQGDLWWHDLRFLVDAVEKSGACAWVWSDRLCSHPKDEFFKNMPKSVVQSPWWYSGSLDPERNAVARSIVELAESGYDVVPCGSNCFGQEDGLSRLVSYCKPRFDQSHLRGFLMAPWLEMNAVFERRLCAAAGQVCRAREKWVEI